MPLTSRPVAPIALFVFKRPVHTRRMLESLAANPEFLQSPLHVFCDGARRPDEEAAVEATRAVVRAIAHPQLQLHEAPVNRGLAKSVQAGVNQLCERYGTVIVVEDDLVVAPTFLAYLNGALARYQDEPQVMQISAHMFGVDLSVLDSDALMLPFPTSWGWATWRRAWQSFDPVDTGAAVVNGNRALRKRFDLGGAYPYVGMLRKQLQGRIDSWAIRWYLAIFKRQGLVLYPAQTLVNNGGFDGSGTHGAGGSARSVEAPGPFFVTRWPQVQVNTDGFARVRRHLASQNHLLRRLVRLIGRRLGIQN